MGKKVNINDRNYFTLESLNSNQEMVYGQRGITADTFDYDPNSSSFENVFTHPLKGKNAITKQFRDVKGETSLFHGSNMRPCGHEALIFDLNLVEVIPESEGMGEIEIVDRSGEVGGIKQSYEVTSRISGSEWIEALEEKELDRLKKSNFSFMLLPPWMTPDSVLAVSSPHLNDFQAAFYASGRIYLGTTALGCNLFIRFKGGQRRTLYGDHQSSSIIQIACKNTGQVHDIAVAGKCTTGCEQLGWSGIPIQWDAVFDAKHVEVASFEEGAEVTRYFSNGYFSQMESFKFGDEPMAAASAETTAVVTSTDEDEVMMNEGLANAEEEERMVTTGAK